MNKKLIPVILASTALLSACDKGADTASNQQPAVTVSKEDAVAAVNGVYISKASLAMLESEITQRNKGQSLPKKQLIEELIQRELLVQDAKQKQLDQSAEFLGRLETIKNSLLSQASVQNYLKSNPITDALLKSEYDKNIASAGVEYKARHILVKTEEEAKTIIAELVKGTDFAELAKTKSTGPSGPKGGDLGWFADGQMVAPFSKAVVELENNKFTTAPVETQFGWHVILREDSRSQTPPPFESIKEQIRPMLQRKKMKEFFDSLRQQAKIEDLSAPPVVAPIDAKPTAIPTTPTAVIEEGKAQTKEALDKVKAEVTEQVGKAKSDLAKKLEEAAASVTNTAKQATTDAVEKADKAITKSATNVLNAITK